MFVGEAATRCQSRDLKCLSISVPINLQTARLNPFSVPPPERFYLIGGGIPIIVCGITAAANIKNYGSRASAP